LDRAKVADQPGVAERSQRGEVLADRLADRQGPQVHQVEVIAAQLAQVLLDLAAELVRNPSDSA
jgi:hypothetical protein